MEGLMNIEMRKKNSNDHNSEQLFNMNIIEERSTLKGPLKLLNSSTSIDLSINNNSSSTQGGALAVATSTYFNDHGNLEFLKNFDKELLLLNIKGSDYAGIGDYKNALLIWKPLWFDHHYFKAASNIAMCFSFGKFGKGNLEKARMWRQNSMIERAINYPSYLYNLPDMILYDILSNERVGFDQAARMGYLNMAVQLYPSKDQIGSHTWIGEEEGHNTKDIFKQLEMALRQNDPDPAVCYYVGVSYEHGLGVDVDVDQAAHMYQAAACMDDRDALHKLAEFYQYGRGGLAIDLEQAIDLYQRAAGKGNKESAEAGDLLKAARPRIRKRRKLENSSELLGHVNFCPVPVVKVKVKQSTEDFNKNI